MATASPTLVLAGKKNVGRKYTTTQEEPTAEGQ